VSTEDQMSIEDRVRTATRAGASLIRDVRPLDAPAPARLRRRPEPAPRRWVNWGMPLAAAAAVSAIALTLVAIRQPGIPSPAAGTSGTASPAASASGTASPTASGSGIVAPATIPRYYAVPTYDAQASHPGPLIVGDDLTGKAIDTVSPPPGLFLNTVQGTSEDGTFLVEASVNTAPYGAPPYSWYMLRLAPGSARPYQLTKLPIELPGSKTFALGYALSPDGQELAVESTDDSANAKPVMTLAIYSVSAGAQLHAWTVPTQQITRDTAVGPLSWLSDGRHLVFSALAGSVQDMQLRTLDVAGTGTDLMVGSQALFTADSSADCASLHVTPDGRTVICPTRAGSPGAPPGSAGCAYGALRFTAFPLPDEPSGKPARVLYRYPGTCHDGMSFTLWTDASASSVIGVTSINVASKGVKEAYQVGVITGGRFRPLNIAKSVPPGDYADLAF
jgi:hypothetical protein